MAAALGACGSAAPSPAAADAGAMASPGVAADAALGGAPQVPPQVSEANNLALVVRGASAEGAEPLEAAAGDEWHGGAAPGDARSDGEGRDAGLGLGCMQRSAVDAGAGQAASNRTSRRKSAARQGSAPVTTGMSDNNLTATFAEAKAFDVESKGLAEGPAAPVPAEPGLAELRRNKPRKGRPG